MGSTYVWKNFVKELPDVEGPADTAHRLGDDTAVALPVSVPVEGGDTDVP